MEIRASSLVATSFDDDALSVPSTTSSSSATARLKRTSLATFSSSTTVQAGDLVLDFREPIHVDAFPAARSQEDGLADSRQTSIRSFTPLKMVFDSFLSTVWLCDWHSSLPPNYSPSAMERGPGMRLQWSGKRLAAVKHLKRKYESGWDEYQENQEIKALRTISPHPNIVLLYDCFLKPEINEPYLVFEPMEGNLNQLIRSRKGRPFAGGLVASIFSQIVSGLDHIHSTGYCHHSLAPEHILVTTTGLFDYTPLSPIAPPNQAPEKDIVADIKLSHFVLARETKSHFPYSAESFTTLSFMYHAPEVLLQSDDCSKPMDMWALGTIMAEVLNLRPMFPNFHPATLDRICEVLGDPSNEYGMQRSGGSTGGGPWNRGLQLAQRLGYEFRKNPPSDFYGLFDGTVPSSLINCIRGLLKYDPDSRLTSGECLKHQYLVESLLKNKIPTSPSPPVDESNSAPLRNESLSVTSSQADEHNPKTIKKINKNEAERVRREAERQGRARAEKMQRKQARAVMLKRNAMMGKLQQEGQATLEPPEQGSSVLRSTHSTSGYQCIFCQMKFHRRFNLQIHLNTHRLELEQPFVCPVVGCEAQFHLEEDFPKHVAEQHSTVADDIRLKSRSPSGSLSPMITPATLDLPRRLMDTQSQQLVFFADDAVIPEYAILSHRWTLGTEVSMEEYIALQKAHTDDLDSPMPVQSRLRNHAKILGYMKIVNACEKARRDGINWIWIDTCCIDKGDHDDVARNVKSMYGYYRNAKICYAFLADVGAKKSVDESSLKEEVEESDWFGRGWTLQELLAPKEVIFFNRDWEEIGRRSTLTDTISLRTGIPEWVIEGKVAVQEVDVVKRLCWSVDRQTTKPEDQAYCLFGILGVAIEPSYGEGVEKAFDRLQKVLLRRYPHSRRALDGVGNLYSLLKDWSLTSRLMVDELDFDSSYSSASETEY